MRFLLLLLCAAPAAWGYPPPHPAVVAVRHEEERLPPHLRSRALHNPNLQEILPLTSLLHKGEQLVYQREADDVPRREIYNILTHAGLLPRNPHLHPSPPKRPMHRPHTHSRPPHINHADFFDLPFIGNAELLQYL